MYDWISSVEHEKFFCGVQFSLAPSILQNINFCVPSHIFVFVNTPFNVYSFGMNVCNKQDYVQLAYHNYKINPFRIAQDQLTVHLPITYSCVQFNRMKVDRFRVKMMFC